jgi:hypothetical protein
MTRRSLRIVTLGLVFVVGAFIAQGEAADAQQIRYTSGHAAAERFTVPDPIAASPTSHRIGAAGAAAREGTQPAWIAVLRVESDQPPTLISPARPQAEADEPQPPNTRPPSDRGPPSPVR